MDYEQLNQGISQLNGDRVLELAKEFLDSNPDEMAEKKFIIAAQDGVNKVSEKV